MTKSIKFYSGNIPEGSPISLQEYFDERRLTVDSHIQTVYDLLVMVKDQCNDIDLGAAADVLYIAMERMSDLDGLFEKHGMVSEGVETIAPPESLIGRKVTVYDRYLFAVPVVGKIVDVSNKDGAYSVQFYDKNPGGPNVTKHNGTYFHYQQCQLIDEG